MWPKRRRQQVLRDWRERRGAEQLASFDASMSPATGVAGRGRGGGRRGRAPLPRLRLPRASFRAQPARLVSLVLAVALALVALHLNISSRYAVHGATVHGNRRTPSAIIVGASGLEGINVFRINRAAAIRRIELLDDIRHARVGVAFPNRAWITVEETAPVFLWETPAGALVVDESGRVIQAPPDTAGLVRVKDGAGALGGPGDRLPDAVAAAGRIFGARFGPQSGTLTYDKGTGFGLVTAEGWPVRLGLDAGMAARQAATLASLAPRLATAGNPVELIDLRFERGSYYRLKGETR